jgi:hypothetical protein
MKTLILNSSNISNPLTSTSSSQSSGNSNFTYKFPQTVNFKNSTIGVAQISQYFSTFNISTAYNNNSFTYYWFDSSGNVTQPYTVTIPNGYYSVADINAYLTYVMTENLHYLVNGTNYVYFLQIEINQTYYATQLYSYGLNTTNSSANSWTLPSGATWAIPTTSTYAYPYFLFNSTNNFYSILGYSQGYQFPTTGASYTTTTGITATVTSTTPVEITPYSSFLVYCSLVNNTAVIPASLIYAYTPQNVAFGAIESYQPPVIGFNKIQDGAYNQFELYITDQNNNPVVFQDPQTVIILLIKDDNDNSNSNGNTNK